MLRRRIKAHAQEIQRAAADKLSLTDPFLMSYEDVLPEGKLVLTPSRFKRSQGYYVLGLVESFA
jgi:hypothetical protein